MGIRGGQQTHQGSDAASVAENSLAFENIFKLKII
jgi:hypothetical protein